MRTRVNVLSALVLAAVFGVSGRAQGNEADEEWLYASHERYVQANLERLEKAYLCAFECPLEGVAESALREVARIKITHLEWESEDLTEALGEISREGSTPAIRYKASLVKALFETPGLFALEEGKDFRTPSQLYLAVARRLEVNLLAGN